MILDRLEHLFLNAAAYYVFEPRFRSGKWWVADRARPRLERALALRAAAYDDARAFFHEELHFCKGCDAPCCWGKFDRFTVYDHIAHLTAGVTDPPPWRYTLHPVHSYAVNRDDEGLCLYLAPGEGCRLDYSLRPAMCVWGTCSAMLPKLGLDQRRRLHRIRRQIDRAHLRFAVTLLFGGMRKVHT